MASEANKDVVRRFYADGETGASDDAVLAADVHYHGPPFIGEIHGREGFKQVLSIFRSAFPGFETSVDDLVAEGDRVVARHTHYATQRGEFNGIPATGKSVVVPGMEIFRLRDGQIVEFWHMDDFLGLLQQLGAVPTPGAAG